MSKLETPMIEKYWQQIGGILIEEYLLVPRGEGSGARRADAIIIQGEVQSRLQRGQRDVKIEGKDVIIVQAKAHRLGMYLMGQGIFSYELTKQLYKPKNLKSIILCTKDDATLKPFLIPFPNVEVVVMPEYAK